jgi:hypothetical protein
MPETTSMTRFAHRHAHPPRLIKRWLSISAAVPQSLRGERGGINARRSGGVAPRQCQRLVAQSHRLPKQSSGRACADIHAFLPVSLAFMLSPTQFRFSERLIDRPTRLNQPRALVTSCADDRLATSFPATGTN